MAYYSAIYSRQDMEATKVFTSRWMWKKKVRYVCVCIKSDTTPS